jgi:undecaprenyl-diphosphatase
MSPWPEQRSRWARRDLVGAIALHRAAAHPGAVHLLAAASRLGDGVLWYVVMAVLPILDRVDGLLCALQMSAVGVVNVALYALVKRRIGRPRPFAVCPQIRACAHTLDEFSFPSGHTLHAVAYAVLLNYHYPTTGPLVWVFAALIAASRVVLGLHYPSDVLAGALTGLATGSVAIVLGRIVA